MTPPMPVDRTYLVECFAPGIRGSTVGELAREAGAAANRVAGSGRPVEYLGATLVPDDEVVLLSFRASSTDAVRLATAQLSIPCGRVVEAVAVGPDMPARGGAAPG